jgi:hypothetical protein
MDLLLRENSRCPSWILEVGMTSANSTTHTKLLELIVFFASQTKMIAKEE